MELLGYESYVPGNVSRVFFNQDEARSQPAARVQCAWDTQDPYVRNSLFNSSLIAYDDQYCTTCSDLATEVVVPTMDYFTTGVVPHLPGNPSVIDIGCGQGEFVALLRKMGLIAVGYDPACRSRGGGSLRREFWRPDQPGADLYVMRCVLPHIRFPWDFLDAIADSSPSSLALIEFQRLEWILSNGVWQQINHDHVNMFRAEDFRVRYDIVAEGEFADGEWGWVLLRPTSRRIPESVPASRDLVAGFEFLQSAKQMFLSSVTCAYPESITIWGASGKGSAIAFALFQTGVEVVAVDANSNRWGRFLEVSGAIVISPDQALERWTALKDPIVVSNPRHRGEVQNFMPEGAQVRTLSDSMKE